MSSASAFAPSDAAGLACNHSHGALISFGLKQPQFNQIRSYAAVLPPGTQLRSTGFEALFDVLA
jgi:hypothetical protein